MKSCGAFYSVTEYGTILKQGTATDSILIQTAVLPLQRTMGKTDVVKLTDGRTKMEELLHSEDIQSC